MNSNRSEFIMLYGRRRIGKTFLVRNFFNDEYAFHFVGAHRKSMQAQLDYFREALVRFSGNNELPKIKNWHTAFLQLQAYLECRTEKRKVIFFDEMPWMDTQGGDFVSELEYFWASWVQNRDDIVFIACGSRLFPGVYDRCVSGLRKIRAAYTIVSLTKSICVRST